MVDFGLGKEKKDFLRILFFLILGAFILLYMFSNAIQEQGIPTDITMYTFVILLAVSLWILIFIVSTLSPKRRLDGEDWLIVVIAGMAVLAIFIFFPGIIPESFKAAIVDMQSMVGL